MSQFLTIGLGASAGGIQALRSFFEAAPPDAGIAYVVILHLSPNYDSQLAQLLQGVTQMPVVQVTEKTRIARDHVYVIPPDKHLTIAEDSIVVSSNTGIEERRAPVDIFFRSLAESHGPLAVSVILSGTGANGSMGLKRVKERGGAVFVQNPREAEFTDMPRNAIATDLVDDVLNVADIPAKIIAYRNGLNTVHIPEEPKDPNAASSAALREVFTQLRHRTGHDFSNYKRPTLLRRIERRINICNLPDLPAYAAYMVQHPEETQALLKDLLISVTNFFRDRAAFEKLETEVLPKLLESKDADGELRIWVAACATGEEAYSIAMICADLTTGRPDAPKVQILATDIDEAAIATAREGVYTLNDAADVSPERLARYFNKEGDSYRIRREIRETILFAAHNFLKDPPFSRLDLVTCRNVLIYLNHQAQQRLMASFHFSLRPGGFLMLGLSESVDGASDLFASFNREQHIWQSRQVISKHIVVPEFVPRTELRLLTEKKTPVVPSKRVSFGELHQRMLEQYAPPSLVIDEEYNIVHLTDQVVRYLQFSGGEPSQNLLKIIHEELRADLRNALYQASRQGTTITTNDLKLHLDNGTETLNIHVRPTLLPGDVARGFLLVIFEPTMADNSVVASVFTPYEEPISQHLEAELDRLKAQLRASNEQHEFAAEELKAGNEELQALNEELRSASEELETSKEELQSINEELSTVNQELKVKVEEAGMVSNNLRNIINSTDVGTIILDRSFRILLFSPAVRSIFNLIPADHSRPLSDITNKLVEDHLMADAAQVLKDLNSIEREVTTTELRWFLMRISPNRTEEDRIQGVVITFLDITKRIRAEEAVRSIAELDSFRVALLDALRPLQQASAMQNEACRLLGEHLGVDRAYYVGINNTGSFAAVRQNYLRENSPLLAGTIPMEISGWMLPLLQKNVNIVVPDVATAPVIPEGDPSALSVANIAAYIAVPIVKDGTLEGALCVTESAPRQWTTMEVAIVVETSERIWTAVARADAEEALRNSEERLRVTVESATDYAIITTGAEGKITGWSRGAEQAFGWSEAEVSGQEVDLIFTPEDRDAGVPQAEKALAVSQGYALDERWHIRKDGSRFFMSGVMRPILDGQLRGFVKVARDLTERQRVEEALMISEERYRTSLQAADMGAWDWNMTTNKVVWNGQHYLMLGLPPEEGELETTFFLSFVHPDDITIITAALKQAAEETGSYQAEFRIIRADTGAVHWMAGFGRAVSWKDGIPLRMMGVMYDITVRRRVEEQREEFIGIASHELKTPLAALKAYAEVLQDIFQEEGDEQSAGLMVKMEGQIDRLTELIRALLDVTRLREGRLELQPERFNLAALVEEVVEDIQLTTTHRIEVVISREAVVEADRERMRQVVINLLSNAVKYSPGETHIVVSAPEKEGSITVSVQDFGIGMSNEVAARVFDRFYRADDASVSTYPGLGLGLYISSEIVAWHGGRMWVESQKGTGSIFYFSLPAVPAPKAIR